MMHRRLSSTGKGKAVALEHQPAPRVGRVRVSEPITITDNHRHVLTLIGRVTNPSVQKVWSLIPFFTDHWKADIPPIGSDLGLGMFQFKFELESDLLTVLEKGPYHYARWMVILQRWEPTISPSFPSMIPFWIKIQGIPIHLWSEEVAIKIGEDLGTYESAEITAQSFRMRVHINGRLPIIKTSIIEYPNGDEITATLVYEKLEKHCLHCGKLDHEQRGCLEAKHQKKALLAAQRDLKGLLLMVIMSMTELNITITTLAAQPDTLLVERSDTDPTLEVSQMAGQSTLTQKTPLSDTTRGITIHIEMATRVRNLIECSI